MGNTEALEEKYPNLQHHICSLLQTWVKMFDGLMKLRFGVFGYHPKNLFCTKTTLYISRWKTIFTDQLLFSFSWNQNLSCAAFDKVDHSILFKGGPCTVFGIRGTPLDCYRLYLPEKYQLDCVHYFSSLLSRGSHGVPQCSVLGTISLTLYSICLKWIHFHCCDAQLYLSMKPKKTE